MAETDDLFVSHIAEGIAERDLIVSAFILRHGSGLFVRIRYVHRVLTFFIIRHQLFSRLRFIWFILSVCCQRPDTS